MNFADSNVRRALADFLVTRKRELQLTNAEIAEKTGRDERTIARYMSKEGTNLPERVPDDTYIALQQALDFTHVQFKGFFDQVDVSATDAGPNNQNAVSGAGGLHISGNVQVKQGIIGNGNVTNFTFNGSDDS